MYTWNKSMWTKNKYNTISCGILLRIRRFKSSFTTHINYYVCENKEEPNIYINKRRVHWTICQNVFLSFQTRIVFTTMFYNPIIWNKIKTFYLLLTTFSIEGKSIKCWYDANNASFLNKRSINVSDNSLKWSQTCFSENQKVICY